MFDGKTITLTRELTEQEIIAIGESGDIAENMCRRACVLIDVEINIAVSGYRRKELDGRDNAAT